MKFSDDTVAILKNFSGINPSLILKPGKILKTVSPQKTVIAEATLDEEIEGKAAIYDLSRFLATLSLFNSPKIDFKENKFVIGDGKNRVNYTYAAESMIVAPPEKNIKMPAIDIEIENLEWQTIASVIKAASILNLTEIAFIGDGENIRLAAVDSKNSTADTFDSLVGVTDKVFEMIIKVENLRLMSYNYKVTISSAGMAHFKSEKIQYWVVVEKNSKFGG